MTISTMALLGYQFFALIRKRIIYTLKQPASLIIMVIMPSLVISCSIFLQKYTGEANESEVHLDLERFRHLNMTVVLGGLNKRVQVSTKNPSSLSISLFNFITRPLSSFSYLSLTSFFNINYLSSSPIFTGSGTSVNPQ